MLANYHTHTPRCRHAEGAERDYLETALRAGFRTLGFSDHAPMPFSGGYYSTMRMYPEETAGYVRTLLELREEYRGRIALPIGFEAEFYPGLFDGFLRLIAPFPIDYLILGQHYLGDEIGSAYTARETDREDLLARYVSQCCAALRTGRFTYFAHPDIFFFTGSPAVYRREMTRLCRTALETETPLELNMLGASTRRNYPGAPFWEIAGEVGNSAVLGCDAHTPDALVNPEAERYCRDLAERFDVPILDEVPLKPPLR